jgi:hypothetical protein
MKPAQQAYYQKYFPANLAEEAKKVFGKKLPDIVKEQLDVADRAQSDVTEHNSWTKMALGLVDSFDYDSLYNSWQAFEESRPYKEFLSLISMLPENQSSELEGMITNISNMAEDWEAYEGQVEKDWATLNRKIVKYFDKLPEKVKAKTKSDLVGESAAIEQILSGTQRI